MSSSDELSVIETGTAKAPTPGQQLRLARETCGLTLEQVNTETNLSLKYLQAIEADDFAALPGMAFARGYARRYAQLVHLDGATLIAEMDALAAAKGIAITPVLATTISTLGRESLGISQVNTRKSSDSSGAFFQIIALLKQVNLSQVLSVGSLLLLLLLLLGSLFWQSNNDADIEPMANNGVIDIDTNLVQQPVPATAVASAPIEPTVLPSAAAPMPDSPSELPQSDVAVAPTQSETGGSQVTPASSAESLAATPAQSTAVAPTPSTTPKVVLAAPSAPATLTPSAAVAAPPVAKPASAAATPSLPVTKPAPATSDAATTIKQAAPVASPPGIDSLNFSFSGKSWISVRDATGQELVYGLKNAGQAVTVTGQAPFSINIGNVHVTSLSRNGRNVNLKQYARGEIASFRLAPAQAVPAAAPKPNVVR